ncbi:serine hydrolase [Sphingosinicella sp. CPCC 101087]|uniref:serine hydrolase domain-containing protein n=1 Tax=Sphingosinicella sp. CPCC 101087 TaxID=2497754 RepID=UPI001FB10513|nr:serine hydrolase domain-containing protein [Sphingosinicella sp. CPCC 101087]
MSISRLLLATLMFGASATAVAQERSPSALPAAVEQVSPSIDSRFRRFQEEAHVPGLVWGIVKDGRLVHSGFSGVQDLETQRRPTADTLFRIASMSKAFTALAILKLRDEGRLSLDALAETYVPEMRGWRYPTTDSPRIRVRDLLSHVGGLVTDDPWGDRQTPMSEEDFTLMLSRGAPFSRVPQTQYEYSNFGYAVLGRIVTNVSGRPFKDYIEQEIMRPLGMESTGYDIFAAPQERRALGYRWENEAFAREPGMAHGAFGAMGGVQTSLSDYARWVAFLLSAWPARDGPEQGPVRRSTVRELAQGLNFLAFRPRPGLDGAEPCRTAIAYAMGLIVARDCDLGTTLAHGGGFPGYGSYVVLMPDHGVGIFAFANRTYAAPSAPVFEAALELERAGLLEPRSVPVSEALAGAYRAAGEMYRAGSLEPGRDLLAMNFLMDRSADNWAREFARLKTEAGACRTDGPITATGALSGRFLWTCDRGRLEGQLLLAPTEPAGIQALRLSVASDR